MSARDRVFVAVATRPPLFVAVVALRLTDLGAAFFRPPGFSKATCFELPAFLRVADLLLDAACVRALVATVFFLADFFATVAFLRRVVFLGDFFCDDAFLLTLDFFPADFFRDDDLRDAAFCREATALARFLLAAFLAAIVDSCRSKKNAELYIDCADMEVQKQGFFDLFQSMPSFGDQSAQSGSAKASRAYAKGSTDAPSGYRHDWPFQSFYRMNSITLTKFDGLLAATIKCD
jgi:hypothetical protein